MTKRSYVIVGTLLLSVALLTGCSQGTPSESTGTLNITVSILPQKYFVERIGGARVDVNVMVQPGASPATYEPKPEQFQALSKADAYISIGVPFEDVWLDRISSANSEILLVDSAQGIERIAMAAHHHEGEAHEDEAKGNLDPHIWLSPRMVRIQAQNIYDALVRLDPEREGTYKANLDRFIADIDVLDVKIRETLAWVENRKFMVFHPSWGYFARDYDLEMIAIEIGGQEPSAAELANLVKEAQAGGIKIIFAQPEFSTRDAEIIANEIGGEVLLVSPLAADWLDNMRNVAETFAEAMEQ